MNKIRIKLKAYDHMLIDKSTEKIVKTAKDTGALVLGPIPLPNRKTIYTVNRSVFVDKKSREQFQITVHSRIVDLLNSTPKTVESLMKLNIPVEQEIESTNKENKQDNYSEANSQNSSNSLPPFRNDSDYQQAIQNSMQNEVKREPIITDKKVGRNEKVKIKNLTSGEMKEMKYKHAEKYLTNSDWIISDNN